LHSVPLSPRTRRSRCIRRPRRPATQSTLKLALPDAERTYDHDSLDRSAAHRDGRAGRLRPAHHGWLTTGDPRQRPARPPAGDRGHAARADALTRLPHPLNRAAEAVRDEASARLRLRDPWARPLPRQRLLPAGERRRRVPPDPDADPHAPAARYAGAPLR